jgi:hypothetical protein
MKIETIHPRIIVVCKICKVDGTLKKNIGDYCFDCLRKYKIKYPEYINPIQQYMYMKAILEKRFDKINNT